MRQVTLKSPFSVHGKGLHTGMQIDAEFCPAPKIMVIKFSAWTLTVNL